MKPKTIRWRISALRDLRNHHDWLAAIEGAKPRETIARIRSAVGSMRRLGDIGRPAPVAGLRELSVRNAPYVVVYRLDASLVEVIAVYHTARKR